VALLAATPRTLLGGAAGAALAARYGDADTPLMDRMQSGGLAGAGVGFAAPLATAAANRWGRGAVLKAANAPFNHLKGMSRRYQALLKSGKSQSYAALHGLGTFPAFIGAGAGIGALVGSQFDAPGTGGAVGVAAGAVARPLFHAGAAYGKLARVPFARSAAITGLSALAASAWMMHSDPEHVDTGYYDDAGEAQSSTGRINDRLDAIGAGGDLVFGMHRGRHG
jgi:hypothetical protein